MFRRSIPLILAMLLAAPVVHAQTVDEVLAKHFEAQGGVDKLHKLQTVRMIGKMQVGPGMEAPVQMDKKRPMMQRMDFTFSGMTGTSAFDGTRAWQLMPFMGQKTAEPMSEDDSKDMKDQADFDGPLLDYKSKGNTVELLGKEQVDGADAWKLKVTRPTGQVETYYIDVDSGLMVKREGKQKARGTEIETEMTFGSFKPVDGFVFPYSMTMGAKGGQQHQTIVIDSIAVNVPMDDARFAMPAPADTTKGAAAAPATPAAPAKPAAAVPADKKKK